MKISLKTEYACRVMAQLGKAYGKGGFSHIDDLAEREEIPSNYLVQILNDLRNGGLIQSRRGKQGGYALARDPGQVTLLDIIRAMEGELLELSGGGKGESGGGVSRAWKQISERLVTEAGGITVEEMAPGAQGEMYYI